MLNSAQAVWLKFRHLYTGYSLNVSSKGEADFGFRNDSQYILYEKSDIIPNVFKHIKTCNIYATFLSPFHPEDLNYILSLVSNLDVPRVQLNNYDLIDDIAPIIVAPRRIQEVSLEQDHSHLSAKVFFETLSEREAIEKIAFLKLETKSLDCALLKYARKNGQWLNNLETVVSPLFPPLLKFKLSVDIFPNLRELTLMAEETRGISLVVILSYFSNGAMMSSLESLSLGCRNSYSPVEVLLLAKLIENLETKILLEINGKTENNKCVSLLYNALLWRVDFLKRYSCFKVAKSNFSFQRNNTVLVKASNKKFFKKFARLFVS
eukprot:snap_masked-scaffold_98-processed-gene-0.18-mRNA-1 protein AED:1.00 eAED:1.00 QI:0/0/0/0/1/1/2/0/320